MAVTSLGQSGYPAGGVTAQQPIQANAPNTPASMQAIVEALTPIQARFRANSNFLKIALPQASFTAPGLGQPVPVQITNVGLAIRLITEWNIVLQVTNSATAAQTFTVSPLYPLNLIANTQIQINGGAAIYNVSGPADLSLMFRQKVGTRRLVNTHAGWAAELGYAIDAGILQVHTLGANLTATNSTSIAPNLSGLGSVSVAGSAAAGANSQITLRFVTIERIVLDKDSLLGAPPLQNNSTQVQVTRQLVGALSGTRNDFQVPFYSAGAGLTFSLISGTADTSYEFASVPGDPALYQGLVTSSFQQQEQRGFAVSTTGAETWNYPVPINAFVVAMHNLGIDTNGAVLPAFNSTTGLGLLKLVYAGQTLIPVREFPYRDRAAQFMDYDGDPQAFPGFRVWDGERTSDVMGMSDNMGWLNTYKTASPQELIDVGASANTPITGYLTREVVITGDVQTVGG